MDIFRGRKKMHEKTPNLNRLSVQFISCVRVHLERILVEYVQVVLSRESFRRCLRVVLSHRKSAVTLYQLVHSSLDSGHSHVQTGHSQSKMVHSSKRLNCSLSVLSSRLLSNKRGLELTMLV